MVFNMKFPVCKNKTNWIKLIEKIYNLPLLASIHLLDFGGKSSVAFWKNFLLKKLKNFLTYYPIWFWLENFLMEGNSFNASSIMIWRWEHDAKFLLDEALSTIINFYFYFLNLYFSCFSLKRFRQSFLTIDEQCRLGIKNKLLRRGIWICLAKSWFFNSDQHSLVIDWYSK